MRQPALASSFDRIANNRLPGGGERFQVLSLLSAQLAGVLNLNPPVVVLNHSGKLEPEHLLVNVGIVLGHDSLFCQGVFANFDVALTGQALHPGGLCAGCVQKVT